MSNKWSKCENGRLEQRTLTIASSATVSDSIDMNAFTLVGVKFPATMTSTIVTLQDSFDGITFEDTYNVANNAISWTFTQGRSYKILPADTAAFWNLKIKVDSSEGADREIIVTLRGV